MYRYSQIALLAFVLVGCGKSPPPIVESEPVPELIGKQAPAFSGQLVNGEPFQLSDSANKVVLLDFWATWCRPCLFELPVLIAIANDYKDRNVVLYTINQGEDAELIQSFLKYSKWQMTVVLDLNGEISSKYAVDGIPQLVMIDQRGVIRQIHVGYNPAIDGILRKEIDELLAESTPAESPSKAVQPAAESPVDTPPATTLQAEDSAK